MKLVFEFPRNKKVKISKKHINEINSFLKTRDSSSNYRGLAVRLIPPKHPLVSNKKNSNSYYLRFEFFDFEGKELPELAFDYSLGYPQNEQEEIFFSIIKSYISLLSFTASLNMKNIVFSLSEDAIVITVLLDNSYVEHVENYKQLLYPRV